jgi:hypothetical protein
MGWSGQEQGDSTQLSFHGNAAAHYNTAIRTPVTTLHNFFTDSFFDIPFQLSVYCF